jgi:uncharacterized repeat protein (TIGR01451 family)
MRETSQSLFKRKTYKLSVNMNRTLRTLTCLLSSGVILNSNFLLLSAQAQVVGSNAGCPPGTREGPINLVRNGTFTTNAGTGPGNLNPALVPVPPGLDFTSDLPYRGDSVYPLDEPIPPGGGGLSIQDDRLFGGQIPNAPAGIVQGRGVNASEAAFFGLDPVAIPNYLYSNPNLNTAGLPVATIPPAPPGTPPPVIWSQTVTVAPNTVYNFEALFFNLLLPNAPGVDPQIRLRLNFPAFPAESSQTPIPIVVGDGSPVPGFPNVQNTRQSWIPVQFSRPTPNAPLGTPIVAQLEIVDESQNIIGDDFGLTAIGLRECIPNIGVAKQASTPVANADGTFTIPYTVTVRNLAPVVGTPDPYTINNVQLTENLAPTFANATIVSVGAPQSQTLTVNPGFNGSTDQNLLQPNANSLAASTQGTVTFTVTIRPGAGQGGRGPFQNTVVATGNTNSGIPVRDNSNDGQEVDPDDDGDPTNNDTPTEVELPPPGGPQGQGGVLLVKRITNVTRGGATLSGVNFGTFVDDPTSTDDNNPAWAQLVPSGAPVGIINLPNDNPVRSGDEVEYTVYFLSNGSAPALSASICDPIPVGTSLVSDTAQVRLGNNPIERGGTVFTPLAPLPDNSSCPDQRNPNGAVIFDLGDVPNTPTNNVGLVRFRVRVN